MRAGYLAPAGVVAIAIAAAVAVSVGGQPATGTARHEPRLPTLVIADRHAPQPELRPAPWVQSSQQTGLRGTALRSTLTLAGDPGSHADPALAEIALGHADPAVREEAVHALGETRLATAKPWLESMRGDDSELVRDAAEQWLAEF